MTYAYGKDLRSLAVRKVLSGMSQQAVADMLEVGKSTISRWIIGYQETGSLQPSKRSDYRKRVSNEELLTYLHKRSDATLAEIAGHFNMGVSTVFFRLRNLGITRKKNHSIRRAR
jgi:transposase